MKSVYTESLRFSTHWKTKLVKKQSLRWSWKDKLMGNHMQTLEIDGKEDMINNCTKTETSEQVEYTKVLVE